MGSMKEMGQKTLRSEPLYDPKLLMRLVFSEQDVKFNPPISAVHPGQDLLVRPLCMDDYERGFLKLLGQLTKVGDVTRNQFLRQFQTMKACRNTYYVTVIEDTRTGQVIGSTTLVLEHKFIHGCAVRGRIEDVVVNDDYRGKQLGKLIVVTAVLLARELNCYKLTLDCKDHLVRFYTSLGFAAEVGNSNSMTIRFEPS